MLPDKERIPSNLVDIIIALYENVCTGAYPRGGHLGHVPPLEPNAQRKNLRRLKDLRGQIQQKSPIFSQ